MILGFIRSHYKRWVDKRFLKKQGFESWEQYNHYHDPCIDRSATTIKERFHGYSVIVHVRYAVVSNLPSWHHPFGALPYELIEWCKEHCVDEFRLDTINGKFVNSKFVMAAPDDLYHALRGMPPECFMSFKSEKDALLFKMYWI